MMPKREYVLVLETHPLRQGFYRAREAFMYKAEAIRRIGMQGEDLEQVIADVRQKNNLKSRLPAKRQYYLWLHDIEMKLNDRDPERREIFHQLAERAGLIMRKIK